MRAAAPAQEEGKRYPTGTVRSTETAFPFRVVYGEPFAETTRSTVRSEANRIADASKMEKTKTRFIRGGNSEPESEVSSRPHVSKLPSGNKCASISGSYV